MYISIPKRTALIITKALSHYVHTIVRNDALVHAQEVLDEAIINDTLHEEHSSEDEEDEHYEAENDEEDEDEDHPVVFNNDWVELERLRCTVQSPLFAGGSTVSMADVLEDCCLDLCTYKCERVIQLKIVSLTRYGKSAEMITASGKAYTIIVKKFPKSWTNTFHHGVKYSIEY